MNIALIAHDQKKKELIDFVKDNEKLFSKQELLVKKLWKILICI